MILDNVRTVLKRPSLGQEFIRYNLSKLTNGGQAVRTVAGDVKVTGFSGFSEYHSCAHFVSEAELQFLSNWPRPEGAVIDVGANLGIVTVLLARRFSDRAVHALEPNPSTYVTLRKNLALNGCSNAHAHALAAAGHDGVLMFEKNPVDRATTSITSADAPNAISVPCVSLDSFVRMHIGQEDIAFLKVDVEGHEKLVFGGAAAIIGNRRAAMIYFEVCPALAIRGGFAPAEAARFLERRGYRLNRVDEKGSLVPIKISEIANVILDNWIATRR